MTKTVFFIISYMDFFKHFELSLFINNHEEILILKPEILTTCAKFIANSSVTSILNG